MYIVVKDVGGFGEVVEVCLSLEELNKFLKSQGNKDYEYRIYYKERNIEA